MWKQKMKRSAFFYVSDDGGCAAVQPVTGHCLCPNISVYMFHAITVFYFSEEETCLRQDGDSRFFLTEPSLVGMSSSMLEYGGNRYW